jgi:Nucleotidyl transferase AbiEii toxin, Type IV TA system
VSREFHDPQRHRPGLRGRQPPAGKILALLDRGAPRDLYDVASMAGGRFSHDADLFRPLFVALSGVLDRAVTAYAVPHRRTLSQAELDEQLIPVLRAASARTRPP